MCVEVLIGAAIARQVQATATTRTKALTARFIHFLLTCGSPGSGNPIGSNYIACVKRAVFRDIALFRFGNGMEGLGSGLV